MKNLILVGAAALALTAVPAAAQDEVAVTAGGDVYVLTDEQTILYDTWPYEQRVVYDAWPHTLQEYYWTLDTSQQTGWWKLDDEQRVRVYEMTPEQRSLAWSQINAQVSGNTTAAVATTAAASASTQSPRFVSNEVTQTTPSGYKAVGSGDDLPICKPDQQDGCINGWEKNKTGNRPLEYWPGRPASEIDEPLPATRPDS